MRFSESLLNLRDLLSGLYYDPVAARNAAQQADLPVNKISFSGSSDTFWTEIIRLAVVTRKLEKLMKVAERDFPGIVLPVIDLEDNIAKAPNVKDLLWKSASSENTLEQVMGAQPTFLPVSFFETGIIRSKAVARVVIPSGLGSGFLTRNNLFITNNHVIPSIDIAQQATIQFNYENSTNGLAIQPVEFKLNPAEGFATSPFDSGDDWTAVRVMGDANARWGAIEIAHTPIEENDYVNIIQHPSGLPKQVAIYHNLVTYAGSSRVQYLTDTLPGSSGSPVFDSAWRLVSLHHSGGWIVEPGTKTILFRNEGIAIPVLLDGLKNAGLL